MFYKPEAEDYFNDLVFILFKEDYFSYLENALIYKNKILHFIENNISTFPSRKTPIQLKNFGSKYIFYKSNQRTTWYIFFEEKGAQFLVTNITNSHSKEAKWL